MKRKSSQLVLLLPLLLSITGCVYDYRSHEDNYNTSDKDSTSNNSETKSHSEDDYESEYESDVYSEDDPTSSSITSTSSQITSDDSIIDDISVITDPIDRELRGCYNYFMDTTNYIEGSKAYGLTQDRFTINTTCSTAATGFLLASYPVFVEEGFMDRSDAKDIVDKTLDTVIRLQGNSSTSNNGIISHFVTKMNGVRYGTSELSTVDTAILVSGCIVAGEYFGGTCRTKANTIWSNVNYNAYVTGNYISMGRTNPTDASPMSSKWDHYGEQLMIYILGAGNPNSSNRISKSYWDNISKPSGTYGGITHVYSWFGSLFTYQFSQAFFDFKNYNDASGYNWFDNSVRASQTDYKWCQDKKGDYKSFKNSGSWGVTACDTPTGYSGLIGTSPRGYSPSSAVNKIQGTVAPTAAIGSMPFTPTESLLALTYFQSLPKLNDKKYGLYDAFNLNYNGTEWYCNDFIGIDKGIEVLQMYNYKRSNYICNLAMQNPYVVEGFTRNGFYKK